MLSKPQPCVDFLILGSNLISSHCVHVLYMNVCLLMPIFHTQVLSRDSVTVTVDAVVYYRVSNPTMATNNVEDFRYASHNGGPGTAVIRINHPYSYAG